MTMLAKIFQDKSGKLDKVELADFLRLVRLSAIKFATDHFKVYLIFSIYFLNVFLKHC